MRKPLKIAVVTLAASMLTSTGLAAGTALAHAFSAAAQPTAGDVAITLDADLLVRIEDQQLGMREVMERVDRLAAKVSQAMSENPALAGAQANLTLTQLSPNRPTFEQAANRPGLDPFHSVSIGGAAIEGTITTADGQVLPVDYDWFSPSIVDAQYGSTWQDADRAFDRFARRIARGQRLD